MFIGISFFSINIPKKRGQLRGYQKRNLFLADRGVTLGLLNKTFSILEMTIDIEHVLYEKNL